MTLVVALLNTYLPEMQRGRTFLEELRYTAILATLIGVAIIAMNAIADGWDHARSRRRRADRDNPELGAP